MTFTYQTGWTLFFSVLFWVLGTWFIVLFSDASWWIALIGCVISNVEIKIETTSRYR